MHSSIHRGGERQLLCLGLWASGVASPMPDVCPHLRSSRGQKRKPKECFTCRCPGTGRHNQNMQLPPCVRAPVSHLHHIVGKEECPPRSGSVFPSPAQPNFSSHPPWQPWQPFCPSSVQSLATGTGARRARGRLGAQHMRQPLCGTLGCGRLEGREGTALRGHPCGPSWLLPAAAQPQPVPSLREAVSDGWKLRASGLCWGPDS